MRKRTALLAALAMVVTTFAASGPLGAQTGEEPTPRELPERMSGTVADEFQPQDPDETVQAFIHFDEQPVAEFAATTGADRSGQQAQGQAVLDQQERLRAVLDEYIIEELSSMAVGANGLRVEVRAGDIPAIRDTPGVESVAKVTRYHLDNESSVPWIGSSDLHSEGLTGEGTTIAVIDTGIDYTHASFHTPEDPGDAPSFDDVSADHLFNQEIVWLAVQDITRGCNPPTNSLFCPGDDVTRGQMAAFLNRALDLDSTDEDFFEDDADSVFEDDINRLAAAGITRGCNPPDNTEFCPDRNITRAEMATFMVRSFAFSDGADTDLFEDDDGNIHEGAIDILGTSGVTRGCNPPDNTEFCPDRNIIRGEMAAFIFRAFDAAGLESVPVPPAPPPYDGESAYEDNDPGRVESGTFPTDKVIGGFDFAGPNYDASVDELSTPSPDPDPLDVNGHGTHVAATAAGMSPQTGDVGMGAAPDAKLLALKVFGDEAGSTDLVSDAIERALDPNNDLSTDDAVDVINMSLGSPFGHPDDPSAVAAQNAVDLGVVVVASAGNEGPNPYVTGSPAVADDVISVAASIDGGAEVLGMPVNSPSSVAGEYEASGSDFGSLDPPTEGDLAVADPLDACTGLAGDVSGQIALIERGTCSFTEKVRNAEAAGAIGALVFNNVEGPTITMGHDGTEPKPTIPAMMVGMEDGEAILAAAEDGTVNVTLTDAVTIPKPELADTMADFSSQGPGFGNVFKPDLSAPGFSIGSANVGTGDGLSLSSGTSMAAPHVAGAVAQLLQSNPDLTPAEVKALLMNSATPANIEGPDFVPGEVPVALQGTGVIHVDRSALDLGGYTSPAGVAMRVNPTEQVEETTTVDIQRLVGAGDATYDVEVISNQDQDGVAWSASDDTVSTTEGSGSVDVTLTADPGAMTGDDALQSQTESDGWLRLTNQADPDDTMVVGLIAVTDPASQVSAEGGEGLVVANPGPGLGYADGFTHLDEGAGGLADFGFRTSEPPEGDYDIFSVGLALDSPWGSAAGMEVDVFIDTDQDGEDDWVVVAADAGLLQGAAPTGQMVTALIDLTSGSGSLQYFAWADYNDRVMSMPIDMTGEFGFLAEPEPFDITVAVFDSLGTVGVSDTVTVDPSAEIVGPLWPHSLELLPDEGGGIPTDPGTMLWLFPNNQLDEQAAVVETEGGGQVN